MDLDGDGHADILSGSYPGELYLFRGDGEGGFLAGVHVRDATGEPLNIGQAAAVFAVDWDRDDDLDLVVGDIRGHVWFVENASGDATLVLGEARKLEAEGGVIRVPRGDAGPVVADWDGDGTLDLIVGCGDGSVRLYANDEPEGVVALRPHRELLPSMGPMSVGPGEADRCGVRVKPCVTDYDGDGRLDLLLGDVLIEQGPEPEIDDEARWEKERDQQRLRWIQQRYGPAVNRVRERVLAALGHEGAWHEVWSAMSPEARTTASERLRDELAKDVEASALQRMMRDAAERTRAWRPERTVHGRVWLLRRAP